MSECVRSIRFWRGLGAVALGVVALAGLTVAALELAGFGRPDVAATRTTPVKATAPGAAVLADEWMERIQSDKSWRNNRSSWSPPADGRNRPFQLQGPPPQPSWFIAPAPANPWMDVSRYLDFDSMPSAGQNRSTRGVGGYRTVCVRSCDGYFFPISHGASELNFSRDQATCTNSCSGAKLYYYRVGVDEPEDMVDLSGQKYSKSKNADLFRTQYVESCKCKPHPWEQEATERHRIYALEDQRQKGNRSVVAELEALRLKNRIEHRATSRRPNSRDETSVAGPARQTAALPNTAPRSDVTRGQSGERPAFSDAPPAGRPAPVAVTTAGGPPSFVTGAVAAAASAATVQAVTSRVTATAPVDAVSRRDGLHSAAIEASLPQPGEEPLAAPEPAEVQPVPAVSKSSRTGRGRGDGAARNSSRQAEARRNEAPVRARGGEWARQVFNP